MLSPELDATGHTASYRWFSCPVRWSPRRRGCFDRWGRRRRWHINGRLGSVRTSHARRIGRHSGTLGIKWAGGRALPIRAALARGERRHLRASGIKRVGGNVGARVGIVKWSRRSDRAYEAGRCVRRNGHTRHGYCDKCTAHGYFRHRAADTRGHRPVHPSLLWSGRKRATLPFTVIAATNAYGRMHASRRRVKQVWCSWVRFSTGLFRGNLNARSFLRCSGPACLAYACDQGSP